MAKPGWNGLALFLAAALMLAPLPGARAQDPVVDVAIVLAVDISRSVNGAELSIQREGYDLALRNPALIAAIKAGAKGRIALSYFEWSRQVREVSTVQWRIIEEAEDLHAFADAIAALPLRVGHGTSISRALAAGIGLLENDRLAGLAGGQPVNLRRVIDISGDGPNSSGPPVRQVRDQAIAAGITINGLQLLLEPSNIFPRMDLYYERCVIGGPGAFLLAAENPEEFAPVVRRKLLLEVSGREPAPRLRPVAMEPVNCLIGEDVRRELIDRYYPGLYN